MGSAYTPGLTVSADVVVRRLRRLPIKGEVLVKVGDKVNPDSVIARALLPGALQTIKISEGLGIEPKEIRNFFHLKDGDSVEKGQLVAETKGLFGLFKGSVVCQHTGVIEAISEVTGNALVREPGVPVDMDAYIQGTVVDVMSEEGATIETRGAMVQGIFGVGGERNGVIRVAVASHEQPLHADNIHESDKGKILIGGSGVTFDAIEKAAKVGALGIVCGGIRDKDLIAYLGYDIGVAITGQESIPLTIMVTEGFGYLAMAQRTFDLFKSLEGMTASINGATQIRAGVIRPEIIVPIQTDAAIASTQTGGGELTIGTPIRVIREPYFGLIGKVTELPPTLIVVDSGAEVRVLKAKLDAGEEVTVPRANVEIIST